MDHKEQLDLNLLQGYMENLGNDIVQQMIELYVQQSTVYFDEISRAITQNSQALWQENCHKMKGAAGSVGFTLVHKQLAKIEKLVAHSSEKHLFLKDLRSLNQEAIKAFNQWVEQP